jgi:hypothetical protein
MFLPVIVGDGDIKAMSFPTAASIIVVILITGSAVFNFKGNSILHISHASLISHQRIILQVD